MSELDAVAISRRLSTRTPSGIAEQIRDLIDAGDLPPGTRLPTVRDIAQEIGVSVGTIAQAWGLLREGGLVETRRRGGTRVTGAESPAAGEFPGWPSVDLLLCSPDPALLPSWESAVTKAMRHPDTNAWGRAPIVEDLQRAVAARWPFPAESWLAVGGGTEALWLATRAAADPGQVIAVEEPAAPGYLDLVRDMGLEPIGVQVDAEGPVPASLQEALDRGARAFVHAPGGPFSPTHSLTESRRDALAELLAPTEVVVVEDDPLGPLTGAAALSLGTALPERTLRAEAYCRAYGIDLRTAVLGGARHLVERAAGFRSGGTATTSRLLQHTLAALMKDPQMRLQATSARDRYAARRALALEVLTEAGLSVHSGPHSWTLWVDVDDERSAALALSSQGVIVEVGSSSAVEAPTQGRLRLSAAQLPENRERLGELAQMLTRAAEGTLRASYV